MKNLEEIRTKTGHRHKKKDAANVHAEKKRENNNAPIIVEA
jgi:hypothetical protein